MLTNLIALSALAGLSAFLGALVASFDRAHEGWLTKAARRSILAFGGGALVGAVGLVLVPRGLESQPLWSAATSFLAGGLVFMWVDRTLQRRGTPVGQLIAMNLDFIPEAIVLGAVISDDYRMAVFLAVIIAAQNAPEGFNAHREILSAHSSYLSKHVLRIMSLSVIVGPLAAMLGYSLLTLDSAFLGILMTFCAGGILYVVFQDVAPEARTDGRWGPSFGAVLGFSVALVGYGLTGT